MKDIDAVIFDMDGVIRTDFVINNIIELDKIFCIN